MRHTTARILLTGVVFASASAGTAVAAPNDAAATADAFLKKHCIRCHGPEKQKAKFRIDTLDRTFIDNRSTDAWVEVLDRINLNEMPPSDEPQPSAEELEQAVGWITSQLRGLKRRAVSTDGRVLLRRLTRTEYANTVRDLLGVTFPQGEGPADLLSPDGSIGGFNKVSKGLLLDPSLMDKYLATAEMVAERAVRVRQPLVPTRTMRFDFENTDRAMGIGYQLKQRSMDKVKDGVLVYQGGARTGYELKHPFNGQSVPITGRYIIRVRAAANKGFREEPIYMDVTRGRQGRLQRFQIDAPIGQPKVYTWEGTLDATISAEIQVGMVNRQQLVQHNGLPQLDNLRAIMNDASKQNEFQRGLARYHAEGYNMYSNRPNFEYLDMAKAPRLFLDYIEVEGPLNGPWPPRSMAVIFPNGLTKENQSIDDARRIFERLLPRAYRRPATTDEVDAIVGLVEGELKMGKPYHEAVRVGIVGMLCSPQFLYLFEPALPVGGRSPSQLRRLVGKVAVPIRPLTDYELATRMSYFIWSSMPDQALLDLAKAGRLREPSTIQAQVERMLADPKSDALVDDFAQQWLRIHEFDRFAPDQQIFPDFYNFTNAGVGDDMKAEPLEMFREMLRKNGSLLTFLDSDWTMVNERLARFYGIDGVTGAAFRRVSLPADSPRGGLLGMAGVHKWGSDGARTKPVERGKYVLDVLFNDAPPPPPPNAGEVQPNPRGQNLTVRERLEQHRTIASCANCHRRVDPYGLALENFNVIGQWRTKQDGEKPLSHWGDRRRELDVSGELPNGQKYTNYAEFKQAMLSQSDRFVRGFAEKLFVYALGRTLEPADRTTIDQLVATTKREGHSLHALIKAIVKTDSFRMK